MKIGILGQGYVGTAVKEIFKKHFKDIKYYDKYFIEKSNVTSLEELALISDFIFLCLPTPMMSNGECDISIIEKELSRLNELADKSPITIVIKSTIPPGTTKSFNQKFSNLSIIFNPEFLTELNFIEDFKNQDRIILGGDSNQCTEITKIYNEVFPNIPIVNTSSQNAEMVKYVTNIFLATKVSFANEVKNICDQLDVDYDKIIKIAKMDKRLGDSHWNVPGPDGKKGFGGSCFPKDINALIYLCGQNKIDVELINKVWENNLKNRPDKDWENLKGRAVSD